MNILMLVENVSHSDLNAKHGLSVYIETKAHRLLFDVGPDKTLFENAKKRNIDLNQIDTVIISHGHIFNPISKMMVSKELLKKVALELKKHMTVKFYTCHCTGKKAYKYLSKHTENIKYISCGEKLEI